MSGTREIVTIQAGNYANFVGTHWWNMQEASFCYTPDNAIPSDINHDVLFREGLNYLKEVTYTPRLILVDMKNSFKSIRKECPLYRFPVEESDPLWDGPIEVIKEKTTSKNPFLEENENNSLLPSNNAELHAGDIHKRTPDFCNLETVWTDFLRTNLHPQSLCLLDEMASSEDKNPINVYSCGDELYIKCGKEIVEDTIRRMAEECDYLQGFHLIFDAYNGFSGVSNHILQHLDDEYNRRPSVCFPLYHSSQIPPIQSVKEQMHRLYAVLLSMNGMNNYSSLFSPMCFSSDVIKLSGPFRNFPFLHYDEKLHYHTSAILAAAIETLTSQFRLKSLKFTVSDVTTAMSMYGRKLVCSSICLPFPLSEDAYLSTMVEKDVPEYFMTSISPFYNTESNKTLYQSAVVRGVPRTKFQRPDKSLFHSLEPEELFGQYLNKYSSSSLTTATVFYEMCNVTSPFPKIFNDSVGITGFMNSNMLLNHDEVNKVPTAASFSNSDTAADFIDDLLAQGNKMNFREYVKSSETTFEKDEYTEITQNLIGLHDNYKNY